MRWLATVLLLFLPAAASAQSVTLTDGDRTVVTGEFLGFDGRFYRILGPYGCLLYTSDAADE